jgi:hypothetical protein
MIATRQVAVAACGFCIRRLFLYLIGAPVGERNLYRAGGLFLSRCSKVLMACTREAFACRARLDAHGPALGGDVA